MEAFIGQIVLFAGNRTPRGWSFCQGQILPVMQNQALFSVIGSTYGGDGRNTFALPDLRSSVPVGTGTVTNLPPTTLGGIGMVHQSSGGSPQLGTLGLNYIICLQGIFPTHS